MDEAWIAIEGCITRGEHRDALVRLLALWQEQPSTALADLVDAVTAAGAPAPLAGKNREARWEAWGKRDRAADPLDVPVLAEALLGLGAESATRRLETLLARGSDPRLARVLLGWAVERPNGYQGYNSASFWRLVSRGLAATRDQRVIPRLETLLAGIGRRIYADSVLREELPGVCAALGAVLVAPAPEAERLLARIALPRARRPEGIEGIEALFDAVYADPASDQARWVLADALQEASDPRGEFVSLQLMPKLTREQRSRMRKLEQEHLEKWLGPLARVVRKAGRRFERGFLAECRISGHSDVPRLDGVRELGTVVELDLAEYGSKAFFERTPLRALRKLQGRCFSIVEVERELPVRVLHGITNVPLTETTECLRRCTSLPSLEELAISTSLEGLDPWTAVFASPFARPLRALSLGLTLGGPLGPWRRAVREGAPHIERLDLRTGITSLRVEPERVTLEHDATSYSTGGGVTSGMGVLEESIAQLVETLASDALEPGDALVIRLVRGRFASRYHAPVPSEALDAVRRAAARFASADVIDVVDES